jgi:transcriptional regulator with XRE-family HTH domain
MNRLREARLRNDKSQLQLMRETGIYFSTISRIERGWLRPSDEQKERLAKALKVSKGWLFPKRKHSEESEKWT